MCYSLFVLHVYCVIFIFIFFFFKQKTAYEMCISDWSSDVCSSDLVSWLPASTAPLERTSPTLTGTRPAAMRMRQGASRNRCHSRPSTSVSTEEIGRASCRERVCQYV